MWQDTIWHTCSKGLYTKRGNKTAVRSVCRLSGSDSLQRLRFTCDSPPGHLRCIAGNAVLRQIDEVSRFKAVRRLLHLRAVLRQLRIRLPRGMWSASEFLGGELVAGAGLHESAAHRTGQGCPRPGEPCYPKICLISYRFIFVCCALSGSPSHRLLLPYGSPIIDCRGPWSPKQIEVGGSDQRDDFLRKARKMPEAVPQLGMGRTVAELAVAILVMAKRGFGCWRKGRANRSARAGKLWRSHKILRDAWLGF
jgi:hypothetical protein